jgi:hypothetical protein
VDDEESVPRAAPNRTIQIDALTDVQLVDNEEDAPLISRAPPPLPPRKPPSVWLLGGVVVITGVLGALGAHFLIPSAPVSAPPPPAEPAAPAEEAVRHVPLGEDFVILAGPEPADTEPDAGLPPTE